MEASSALKKGGFDPSHFVEKRRDGKTSKKSIRQSIKRERKSVGGSQGTERAFTAGNEHSS